MSLAFLLKIPKKSPTSLPLRSLTSTSATASRFFATLNANVNALPDKPTADYYDELVNAAARERDFDMLRHLLNKRIKDHCFNSKNTFRFITNTEASLSILNDIIQALTRLDGFPRKSAFDTLIARLCKVGRADESLRIVDIMARGNYWLTAPSFYPIISLFTRKKKMEDAWHVIDVMKAAGVSPDTTAMNEFLTGYCYCGDITGADGVMKKMEEEGLDADSRTFDALVLGACRAGKVDGALALLRRMAEDGIPALYCTHGHIIKALVKEGYYAQAVKFVIIYAGKEKGLDRESFGLLGSKLIELKRSEEAKLVCEEMMKRDLVMCDKLKGKYNKFSVKNV